MSTKKTTIYVFVILTLLAYSNIKGLAYSSTFFGNPKGQVLGASTEEQNPTDSINNYPQIVTTTAFAQKEVVDTVTLAFETRYQKDPEMEYGEEKVTEEGIDGEKKLTYLLTYWQDEEIDKQLINTEVIEPKEEVVSKGTKIVWRMLEDTEVGGLKYWYKMRVWATKYDANCEGCTGRTYSGTEVVKGVCATDPKTIPLGTNFYVVGYGLCRAEDIGGGIKGNEVDLGFVDASKGAWGAAYTDVYLLTNAPQE
ncbi:MAG: 3d protein [uncultured bacterium]|uniref:G5 domain-containing protein n=1 Tax=candidate division WWE3 bacterium RBG_16_37_10 TaxID=1802610 RepID=A0A1F4UXF9_UNCKA|nr:MAG: 3d protein [uncultured bacterium]OGC49611.1 MAG: hypothetical protein A2W32_00875 [candidate division WWE3 bacterium RBG_16_37_10]